jgi:hypothetical protein
VGERKGYMMNKTIICLALALFAHLLFAASSLAAAGQTGAGPPDGLSIIDLAPDRITVSRDGIRQIIEVTEDLKIFQQVPISWESITPDIPVVVQGWEVAPGRINARVLVWLSETSFQAARRAGERGELQVKYLGRILSTAPLIIAPLHTAEQVVVEIGERTLLLQEEQVTIATLNLGDRIRLQPGIITKFPEFPQGPGHGKPPGFRLPMAPSPVDSFFDEHVAPEKKYSPFGFFDPNMLRLQHQTFYDDFVGTMADLGVYWASFGGTFSFNWNLLQERAGDGRYRWERIDRLIELTQSRNIQVIGYIKASQPGGDAGGPGGRRIPSLPGNIADYEDFVAAVVERYDGDGQDDMPGLTLPIKYWSVEDEPLAPRYFSGSGADYARLVYSASRAIKSADPEARVIVSMLRGTGWVKEAGDPRLFMEAFFQQLALLTEETPYDFLDQHWLGVAQHTPPAKQYRLYENWLKDLEETAGRYGFNKVPFVNLEMAGAGFPEADHAADLVKRHVFLLGLGVERILWSGIKAAPAQGLTREQEENYFRRVSLIDGNDRRKLAYWSYKLMVAVLDGADWRKTATLEKDRDGAFSFQFFKHGKPIWVLWNEGGSKEATISIPAGIETVTLVSAVPSAQTGKDVTSLDSAFPRRHLAVAAGRIRVEVGTVPLFILSDRGIY